MRFVEKLKVWSLVVSFGFGAHAAGAASAATRITVGHDWWVGYAGVFVAEAEGYYAEEGLEVQLQMFKSPSESLPPLMAGHLQIALTTLHNLLLVAGNEPDADLRVGYLLDASNGADAIIARQDIAELAGLEGRKVALNINDLNHMLLIVALEQAGLSDQQVQLVNLDPDAAGAAFIAGQVDAAVTWEPWLTQAASAGGRVLFSTADPAAQDLILNAVVARSAFIEADPQAFEAFIRATARGVALLRADPARAQAIVAKKLEVSPEEAAAMMANDKIYGLEDNLTLLGADAPPILATLERIQSFLVDKALVQHPRALPGMLDASFVRGLAGQAGQRMP